MNKQEQIEKMTEILSCNRCTCADGTTISNKCPEMSARNFIPCKFKDSMRVATTILTEAGYINGADFVEWLKEKYGDLFYEIVLRETGYPYREQVDLDKALQEYLKGE